MVGIFDKLVYNISYASKVFYFSSLVINKDNLENHIKLKDILKKKKKEGGGWRKHEIESIGLMI